MCAVTGKLCIRFPGRKFFTSGMILLSDLDERVNAVAEGGQVVAIQLDIVLAEVFAALAGVLVHYFPLSYDIKL